MECLLYIKFWFIGLLIDRNILKIFFLGRVSSSVCFGVEVTDGGSSAVWKFSKNLIFVSSSNPIFVTTKYTPVMPKICK